MSEYKFFLLHKLLVATINCMVLAAVFIAMYRASLYPDDFNHTFFKTLFAVLIPTLLAGYFGKRYLSKFQPESAQSPERAQA